ncbi:hypothetical protein PAPYR_12270 [Paratrimastix pyriformis]|uniref:Uncharacterized protein n=1 Tax=Paratrimastix pyriformis TaxID=342808 RepID=A0ABQ8U259_9EUKA|nr:hypothetical protein PAPYR_12270 [Paratrimastix pyriformis]
MDSPLLASYISQCVQILEQLQFRASTSSFEVFSSRPSLAPGPFGTHSRLWYVSTVLRAYRNPPPTFSLPRPLRDRSFEARGPTKLRYPKSNVRNGSRNCRILGAAARVPKPMPPRAS